MDTLVYVAITVLSLLIILSLILLRKYSKNDGDPLVENQEHVPQAPPPQRAVEARAGGRRVARRRLVHAGRRQQQDDSDEEQDDLFDDIAQPEGKVGAKKLAKLQAKEEKRRQAEAEKEEREERKRRDALQETQRKKDEAKEAADEAAREEELKQIKEEEEKREHEEYLKLKEAFTVDEEGTHEAELNQDTDSLLQNFIDYIKSTKVVMLEDLAAHFQLRTQSCIERVQELQDEGRLPGVMDDRGKFIYITQKEYESVAKFIQQRGRVSITELAESSNKLITLTPDKPVLTETPVNSK